METNIPAALKSIKIENSIKYYELYCGVGVAFIIFFWCHAKSLFEYNISVGRALYNKAVDSVLKTPLRFFDVTPQGRIINRLVKDTETVDFVFGRYIILMLVSLFMILGMIVTVIAVAWPSLIVMIPCVIIYFMFFARFRKVTPQIKRLEAISRSKVFSIC